MSRWNPTGAELLKGEREMVANAELPEDWRAEVQARLNQHAEYMQNPAESIRYLMERESRLRLALGSIAYTEMGDVAPVEFIRWLREAARRSADFIDPLPGEPLLSIVKPAPSSEKEGSR